MADITRFDPFGEMKTLQERMNQFWREPFRSFRGLTPFMEQPLLETKFVPPVDIFEDETTITLTAELPGIEEKDLNITLENNVLTITGERKMEHEEKKENFQRLERSYGRFTRSFTLPATVDTEKINAEFANGLLKIVLNKLEEAKPKQIRIGVKAPVVKPGKAA